MYAVLIIIPNNITASNFVYAQDVFVLESVNEKIQQQKNSFGAQNCQNSAGNHRYIAHY